MSTFLLKFSSFSGRTERVFEVRHYLRSQVHPSIPSSSDNRATFDASISSLPLPIWLDKKRLCSGAILLTFHQLFKNCNLRISTAPFPLTSTVLKSSFHRLSRFGSGSGPSMNNGASGSLGQPMWFHRDASLDIIHHTGYHIPSDVNNMPICQYANNTEFKKYHIHHLCGQSDDVACDGQISTQIPTALNLKRSSIQTIETTSLSRASHHDTSWRVLPKIMRSRMEGLVESTQGL